MKLHADWIVCNTITCAIVRNNKGRKSINVAGIRSKKQIQHSCFSPMLSLNSHTLALSASKRKTRVLCKIDTLLLYIPAGSGTNGQQTKKVWGELEKIPPRYMERWGNLRVRVNVRVFYVLWYIIEEEKTNCIRAEDKLANRDSNPNALLSTAYL